MDLVTKYNISPERATELMQEYKAGGKLQNMKMQDHTQCTHLTAYSKKIVTRGLMTGNRSHKQMDTQVKGS
jgi:hypothetical protein